MRHMTCETRHGPVTKRGNGTTVDVLKGWCRMTDQPRSLQKVLNNTEIRLSEGTTRLPLWKEGNRAIIGNDDCDDDKSHFVAR